MITLLLLSSACFSYANDEELLSCEQVRDIRVRACQVGFNRCIAHNPDSEICFSIMDTCTTKAYEDYTVCINQ